MAKITILRIMISCAWIIGFTIHTWFILFSAREESHFIYALLVPVWIIYGCLAILVWKKEAA